jgi:hypothetical protein
MLGVGCGTSYDDKFGLGVGLGHSLDKMEEIFAWHLRAYEEGKLLRKVVALGNLTLTLRGDRAQETVVAATVDNVNLIGIDVEVAHKVVLYMFADGDDAVGTAE